MGQERVYDQNTSITGLVIIISSSDMIGFHWYSVFSRVEYIESSIYITGNLKVISIRAGVRLMLLQMLRFTAELAVRNCYQRSI